MSEATSCQSKERDLVCQREVTTLTEAAAIFRAVMSEESVRASQVLSHMESPGTESPPRKAGARQTLFSSSVFNFRDIHMTCPSNIPAKRIYRSSPPYSGSKQDINILTDELFVKTVLDFRSPLGSGSAPKGTNLVLLPAVPAQPSQHQRAA